VTRLEIDPSNLHAARLTPPVSKSDAQRALVLAHLTGEHARVSLEGEPDAALPADVRTLRRGLAVLASADGSVQDIDCADGGAPFRLLLTQAAITPGAHVRFTGTPRLGERPHLPLLESLRATLGAHGLTLTEGTPWPLEVRSASGRCERPVFRVSSAQSSQYASSLLLGCAALSQREGRPWSVELEGTLTSAGYLDLTLDWTRRFGFEVSQSASRLTVEGRHPPRTLPSIPGDWSSLGYLVLLAWKTGSEVERADRASAHPDLAVLRIAGAAGIHAAESAPAVLRLSGSPARGLAASGAECPDLLPTLAALGLVLPAPSVFTDVGILRLKESDRLAGIRELVRQFGGESLLEGERLEVRGPARAPAYFEMDSRGDHRLAMSAATLAVLSGSRLTLEDPHCVEKSFPTFWAQLERLGVKLR